MTFTGKIAEILILSGGKQRISLELNEKKDVLHMKDDLLDIEIKKHREKRSDEANRYMWELCKQISEALRGEHTKLEIYHQALRAVGQFEIVPIKNADVEKYQKRWAALGYGWLTDIVGASKIEGYTNVIQYYGSSCYDTREMSILIDFIVDHAKNMGIETESDENLKSMCEAYKCKKSGQ